MAFSRDSAGQPTADLAEPPAKADDVSLMLRPRFGRARRGGGLLGWIARRLAFGVVVLFAITLLVFIATQALPADPAEAILGQAPPERIEALREELGLNRPLTTQYLDWLGGVVTGDLGLSLAAQRPVSSLIGDRFLNTMILLFVSAAVAIPLSFLLGLLAAMKRDSIPDRVGLVAAMMLVAVPEFVVGMILVIVFATTVFQWLPAVTLADPATASFGSWKSMILPVTVLTLAIVPYLYRLVRSTTIDVLESDYIYMARLKGLSNRRILFGHALPNAVVPGIQASALVLAWLLGGVVVIEFLFAYPGLGSLLLESIRNRDLPLIQAIVLIFAAAYVLFNLAADLLTVLVTPRLRTGAER